MQTTWLGAIAFGVLPWLMACSGGVDTVELTLDEMAAAAEPSDEPVSETSGRESFEMHPIQTWEEAGEAYFATLQKPLSGDELEEIEQVLSNAGLDMSEIDVRGRMLAIDDILVHASEFLDGDPVEKGKTLAAINTNRVQGGTTGPQVAPHIYARDSDGEQNPAPFEFHRPYFASTHYFVVANSPTFLQPLVQSALDAIMNSADDCLHDGGGAKTLRAVTAATWASFGQGQGYMPRTFVYWSKGVFDPNAGPNACGDTTGGTAGCAGFPQSRSILISQISEQRMMAGPIIGLVEGSGLGTTYVDGNNDRSRAFVMHEVLHTLGLSHQWQAGLTVPGTSNSLQTQSILQLAKLHPRSTSGRPVLHELRAVRLGAHLRERHVQL